MCVHQYTYICKSRVLSILFLSQNNLQRKYIFITRTLMNKYWGTYTVKHPIKEKKPQILLKNNKLR